MVFDFKDYVDTKMRQALLQDQQAMLPMK